MLSFKRKAKPIISFNNKRGGLQGINLSPTGARDQKTVRASKQRGEIPDLSRFTFFSFLPHAHSKNTAPFNVAIIGRGGRE